MITADNRRQYELVSSRKREKERQTGRGRDSARTREGFQVWHDVFWLKVSSTHDERLDCGILPHGRRPRPLPVDSRRRCSRSVAWFTVARCIQLLSDASWRLDGYLRRGRFAGRPTTAQQV